MRLTESLRTGLRFLLMSLGVSSTDKKPKPAAKPAAGSAAGQDAQK